MPKKKDTPVEKVFADEAKRLDKVLTKHKKANGIVSAKNFGITGDRVVLQGDEMRHVGTGYVGKGETYAEQAKSLVDAVEKELDGYEEAVKKSEAAKKKAEAEADKVDDKKKKEEAKQAEKNAKAAVLRKGKPVEEPEEEEDGDDEEEIEIEDVTDEDVARADLEKMSAKDLTEACKKRGVKIPRGATKKIMVEVLMEAQK